MSTDQDLRVGDICIGQNFIHVLDRNGMECEVIEPEGWGWVNHTKTGLTFYIFGYRVRWADGRIGRQDRRYLRKRRPPEQLVSWSDCVWHPEPVTS